MRKSSTCSGGATPCVHGDTHRVELILQSFQTPDELRALAANDVVNAEILHQLQATFEKRRLTRDLLWSWPNLFADA